MEKIKPCPFCGCKGRLRREKFSYYCAWGNSMFEYSVGCEAKKCEVSPSTHWNESKQEVVKMWNTRSTQ
jgi:hypothetical protein